MKSEKGLGQVPALAQFQSLLQELFRFDLSDLDFGLYRLLRLKRAEIDHFIFKRLPRLVDETFDVAVGEERTLREKALFELRTRILAEIDEAALLPTGEISPEFRSTKVKTARELLEQYESERQRLGAILVSDAQKADVFNHLYAFFSRYYENGDFVPRRRYSSREQYAIPYLGDETLLYWANKDQHYVKTGEAFRDYVFSVESVVGSYRVRFALAEASLSQNGTKGDRRYFFPRAKNCSWDPETKTFTVPFDYRLPSAREVSHYGRDNALQEAIVAEATGKIVDAIPDATLATLLAASVERREGDGVSLLLKRLRHFTRRNTTDYFVHRRLEGFLRDELHFYLKDQVLHIEDLGVELNAKQRLLRVVTQLAEEIIAFLVQIEEVQRQLFEKRKFVLSTDYLITLQNIPESYWTEIGSNLAQLQAWADLFGVRPGGDVVEFLRGYPTLVVDTRHFAEDFKWRLLAAFEDLDDATDGLLINAEAYQALQILGRKFSGAVKCIYIDPPYNTGNDGFIYKDRYRHSTWLSMMWERLELGRRLLRDDGVIFISLDDTEAFRAKTAFEGIFGPEHFLCGLIWQKRYGPPPDTKDIGYVHELILAFRASGEFKRNLLPLAEEQVKRYKNPDNDPRGPWKPMDYTCRYTATERPNLYYPIRHPVLKKKIWPKKTRVWAFSPEEHERNVTEKLLWWGKKGRNPVPAFKNHLDKIAQGLMPTTLLTYEDVGHTDEAAKELRAMLPGVKYTPKPVRLIRHLCLIGSNQDSLICDFFAGSGTTAHAVMDLNRGDGGRRRFVLVEVAPFFDTMLVPRLQKAIYSPSWHEGAPARKATPDEAARSPRVVKLLRLESYEDALHNVAADETVARAAVRGNAHRSKFGPDVHAVRYLARFEVESSASMLNLERVEHPFSYGIEVLTDAGARTERVDLVETFNILYGIHTERLETWSDSPDGRLYRIVRGRSANGRRTLVIWRDTKGLDPAAERAFLQGKVHVLGMAEEIWINADAAVPGARSLDPLLKKLIAQDHQPTAKDVGR